MIRAPLRHGLLLLIGAALGLPAFAQAPAQTAPAAKAAAAPALKKAAAKPTPARPILEQRAVDLLQAMSQRLAAAKSMSFTALASYEYPSRLGPPIVYTVRHEVAFQRPNQLKIVVPGDGPATEFYYDGKEMIAFAPAENLVAVAAAPPTLEAALKQAFDRAAIYFPFTDLLLPDPYGAISAGALLAYVVGPSAVVGGVKTDMLVWASNEGQAAAAHPRAVPRRPEGPAPRPGAEQLADRRAAGGRGLRHRQSPGRPADGLRCARTQGADRRQADHRQHGGQACRQAAMTGGSR